MSGKLLRALVVASTAAGIFFGVVGSAAADDRLVVKLRDECDPVTFNAVIGPGTCVGNGTVTFFDFIAELTATHQAAAWRFEPSSASAEEGQTIVARNRGGEVHTFTEVAAFGPGIVPDLNLLVFGVPGPPLPEFQNLQASDFIGPGGKVKLKKGLSPGVHRFECAIHPWMQSTITVEDDD